MSESPEKDVGGSAKPPIAKSEGPPETARRALFGLAWGLSPARRWPAFSLAGLLLLLYAAWNTLPPNTREKMINATVFSPARNGVLPNERSGESASTTSSPMLKKLMGRVFGNALASRLRNADPEGWEASLLEQVEAMSEADPLIGAKLGAKEVLQRLLTEMKSERGADIESSMSALGALAGYSCQAAVRANPRAAGLEEAEHLFRIETSDGKAYFFGDPLNKLLAESELSVWSLAAGGAQENGCTSILEVSEIFAHVAGTVGSPDFGVPRLPSGHSTNDTPFNYLESHWPRLFPLVSRVCPNPDHWPVLFGLAIQDLMTQSKKALDPCLSLRIVMESAIPMSKVDLGAV